MKQHKEIQFLTNLMKRMLDASAKIEMLQMNRPITLNQIGISSKTFADWKNKNIIPFHLPKENRYWVRLNLEDYVWLKIVSVLRGFGVAFEVIEGIKKFWFEDGSMIKVNPKGKAVLVNTMTNFYQDIIEEIGLESGLTMKEITRIIKNAEDELKLPIATTQPKLSLLTRFIIHASFCSFQGRFIFINSMLLPQLKGFDFIGKNVAIENEHYLSISLAGIIDELISNNTISRENKIKVLGEKELKILEEFRTFSKINAKASIAPDTLELAEVSELPLTANINQECKKYPHQRIVIDIQDHKRVKISRLIKKKT